MNNNHNLKKKKKLGKKTNEFCREKVMNNFFPNYIDLINFKLKCYQKW